MKMKMEDPTTFKNLLKAVATVTDEATFHIKPEDISMRAMDPSRVAMVDFELSKNAFIEYEVTEKMDLCFNVGTLLKLLKRAGKDDALEISLQDPKLKIALIKENNVQEFTMPTLEPMKDDVPTPKITFNVQAKLLSEEFNNRLKDATLASDMIKFIADSEKLVLDAQGDILTAHTELKKGSEALLNLEAKEPSKATYSLSYLSEIVKDASPVGPTVTVEFSNDMPLKLTFQTGIAGKLLYYLAPRIEVE